MLKREQMLATKKSELGFREIKLINGIYGMMKLRIDNG